MELWRGARAPPTSSVELLSTGGFSQQALNIMKIAQELLSAFVPDRNQSAAH